MCDDIFWFACFYRPPDDKTAVNAFCEQTHKILPKKCRNVVVAGDFNLPELKWHDEEWRTSCVTVKPDSLQGLIDEFGLEQIVESPTRGENCLDLIFTSVTHAKETVTVESGVSDHSLVRTVFATTLDSQEVKPKITWRYDKSDWGKINYDLETRYTSFIKAASKRTVNENWVIFRDDITNTVQEHTPQHCATQTKDKPWVTNEIKRAIKKGKRLRYRARTSLSVGLWSEVTKHKKL